MGTTTKNLALSATVFALLFGAAGCTQEARQDLGEAGENVGQATQKSTAAAGEAVQTAGTAVAEGTAKAGEKVVEGAQKTGEAVQGAAARTGEVVAAGTAEAGKNIQKGANAVGEAGATVVEGTKQAGKNVAEGAKAVGSQVAEGTKKALAPANITPRLMGSLVADKTVDASKLSGDTNADAKTFTLKGSVKSAAEKAKAEQMAKKFLAENAPEYKLKSMIKVGAM